MEHQQYPCVARSLDAFVSQVIRFVASGHYFYLTGRIPAGKEPSKVDDKLRQLYDVDRPRWARARRRLGKHAGMHYLRHGRFFVLMATHGQSRFFTDHESQYKDIRRNALNVGGYAIRYTWSAAENRWRVFIRLDRETYRNLQSSLVQRATRAKYASREDFEQLFADQPWQPYRPVREQLAAIVKAANRQRRYAGLSQARLACLPKMRRITRVYEQEIESAVQAAGSLRPRTN